MACRTMQLRFLKLGTVLTYAFKQVMVVARKTASVTYGTAKKKRPGYLVGNLVATNWPIEKALHAVKLVITKFQLNSPIG